MESIIDENKFLNITRCINVEDLSRVLGISCVLENQSVEEKSILTTPSLKTKFLYEYYDEKVGEDEVYIEQEGETVKNAKTKAKLSKSCKMNPKMSIDDTERMKCDDNNNLNFFNDPEWNHAAYVRFFQIIIENSIPYERSAYPIYNHYVAEKMNFIQSNEDANVLFFIVDKTDHDKIGETPPVFLKPAYEIRPTPEQIEIKFNEFYGLDHYNKKFGRDKQTCFSLKKPKKSASKRSNVSKKTKSHFLN